MTSGSDGNGYTVRRYGGERMGPIRHSALHQDTGYHVADVLVDGTSVGSGDFISLQQRNSRTIQSQQPLQSTAYTITV